MKMPNPEIKIGAHASIEEELLALHTHITTFRAALADEAVWLFLTTLGCWGVTYKPLQFISYFLALYLFTKRMGTRIKERRSFPTLIKEIREKIEQSTSEEDTRKARLYDLEKIEKNNSSVRAVWEQGKIFIACWAFFLFSLLYTAATALNLPVARILIGALN